MNDFKQPDGPPPLPQGWKAAWSEQYKEYFYVDLTTGQSQWEKPTQPLPRPLTGETHPLRSNADYSDKVFVEHSDKITVDYSDKIHSLSSELSAQSSNTNNGIHPNQRFRSEQDLLSEFEFDKPDAAFTSIATGEATGWSQKRSCRVMVRKFSKEDEDNIAKADREIKALSSLSDPAVPPILEVFDSSAARFIVLENRQDESLKQYIEGRGTLSDDLLKAIATQLFAALAAIFMAGFTHLRICDETLFIDKTGQLTIKHFDYAHEYSKTVDAPLYAQVEAKYGSDLYVAPEVSTATTYNGRKATLWSCGIAIYYMTTGQLDKLSSIEHPLNGNMPPITTSPAESRHPSISDSQPSPQSPTQTRRRSSLGGRKFSLSSAQQLVIPYPGSTRFEVPHYARDIISKLLITNPLKRAELLEVATKVPKETVTKATRPLVELAWLDYKTHVGPLAGTLGNLPELDSSASSIYSGISNFSNPFASLLGGRRRSSSKNTPYAKYV